MIQGKKVAILGFGKEGASSANFLQRENQLYIFDDRQQSSFSKSDFSKINSKNVHYYFSSNFKSNLKLDIVVRSPGVRIDHPFILHQQSKGAKLTSATQIFFDEFEGEIIGVTGTKGKGTTSTLIYEMLKAQGFDVYLAGNIGIPPLDILPKLKRSSIVVLELSSFQLIDLKKSPHIAIVLMITSEHLDWHSGTKQYQTAKESIVKFQIKEDFAVINSDYTTSQNFAKLTSAKTFFVSTRKSTNGVYIQANSIISQISQHQNLFPIKSILIPGRHNLENVIAACAAAKIKGVKNDTIKKVLSSFKGLKHRLQLVATVNGVSYFNDSYSTVPETAIAAIEAIKAPKILILGGSSKNSDFIPLANKIASDDSLKSIILIGQEREKIKKAIEAKKGFKGSIIEEGKNMKEIIVQAKDLASFGDAVILSPACASFDMFKNYEDRGEQFIKEVTKLSQK